MIDTERLPESPCDLNAQWAESLIGRLIEHGVRALCIAPGSRSAPLALAAARWQRLNPTLTIHTHFDERGLAFFALGLCRRHRRAVAVITTSGTAVPNLLPAFTEAAQSHLALIVVTADRPPELHACGANQAIDQVGLFSCQARAELALPPPDAALSTTWLCHRLDRVLLAALGGEETGPVHINVALREPLYGDGPPPPPGFVRPHPPVPSPPSRRAVTVPQLPSPDAPRLFIAGQLDTEAETALLACAEAAGIPILADIGSSLRLVDHPCIVAGADCLLATADGRRALEPVGHVIQCGGRLTGKRLSQWLATFSGAHWLLSRHNDYLDPTWRAEPIQTDIAAFCRALPLPAQAPLPGLAESAAASAALAHTFAEAAFDELHAVRLLTCALPPEMALFPGNSLTVRLCDLLAAPAAGSPCITQRGASGIDGLIATAAGYATDYSPGVTLLIGDLSALHDLNSLALAAAAPHPLIIVVFNNDGGAIFDLLPAHAHDDHQQLFRMPHGYRFEHAAAQFDLDYAHVADAAALSAAYQTACTRTRGATLIEVDCPAEQASRRLTELFRRLEGYSHR